MSYSFYEVLPFLVHKKYHSLSFHYDFFKDIIKDKEELKALQKACNDLITVNDEGEFYSIFNIPAFTRGDKTFEAKTFNIEVTGVEDRELDNCYEGKTFYHYTTYLTDVDSTEKMVLISHYYAATDHDLTDIEIYLQEDDEEQEYATPEYSYVLIKGEKKNYQIFGVFNYLFEATSACETVKVNNLVKNVTELHIEKVISNTVLLPNTSETINVLNDCIEAYDSNGDIVYVS